jgi:hypothetical protein
MFNNSLGSTPYFPFDALYPKSYVQIPSSIASNPGVCAAPLLEPKQAAELCYNTKAMVVVVPWIFSPAGVQSTGQGNVPVYRYTVGNDGIHFGSAGNGNIEETSTTFSMDFPTGNCAYSGKNLYFMPITQYYIVGNAVGESFGYTITGVGGQSMDDNLVPISLDGFRYGGCDGGLYGNISGEGEVEDSLSIIAVEKIDEITFSPTAVSRSAKSTVTLTCPATKYAISMGYNTPNCRVGLQYLTGIWLEGLSYPIMQQPMAGQPYFTISKANTLGVQDTAVITLPANIGISTGKIGLEFNYPTDSVIVTSANNGGGTMDYFETISNLTVI